MALVHCINCDARISEKALVCPKCGKAQTVICDECGTVVSPHQHEFCPECGNPDLLHSDDFNEHDDDNHIETEASFNELTFRVFIGISFGLWMGYLLTERFTKHAFLEFSPVMLVLCIFAMTFPRLFGFVMFVSIFYHIYVLILAMP